MSPDLILLLGMSAFALIFVGVLIKGLRHTIANPFRGYRPLKAARTVFGPWGEGPIIWGNEIAAPSLIAGHKVVIDGITYSFLSDAKDRAILAVQLSGKANIHVFTTGDKSGWQKGLKKYRLLKTLTPVHLEGNLSQYIQMYCTKNKERELVQLFDPADMEYFKDFCRAYDFEVYLDMLYISQAGNARHAADSTGMLEDAKNFIARNQSVLQRL